jgi:hypothetical protein
LEDTENEIKMDMDLESKKQALADYLKIDPTEILACSVRLNDLVTFQAQNAIYVVGTDEEVDLGVRGYFENNLSELDSAFIGKTAKLSSDDAHIVDRLCQIMDEDIETDILNEAILSVVKKCGDLEELIGAAVAGLDRGQFLSEDGKEISFGKYFIYRFRQGQCSDFEY